MGDTVILFLLYLLIIGLIALFFIGQLIRRGWRKWKKKDPIAASV